MPCENPPRELCISDQLLAASEVGTTREAELCGKSESDELKPSAGRSE
jgi:hypothetical protein